MSNVSKHTLIFSFKYFTWKIENKDQVVKNRSLIKKLLPLSHFSCHVVFFESQLIDQL